MKKVAQALNKVSKALKQTKRELDSLKLEDVSKYKFNKLKKEFSSVNYKEIYLNNLQEALEKNQEYNHAAFSFPLYSLILEPNILKFDYENKTVKLQMDKYAGTIDNWAKAIKMAREDSSGVSIKKASNYWRMIYKAARESWKYQKRDTPKSFKSINTEQKKSYFGKSEGYYRRRYVQNLKEEQAKDRTQELAQRYWEIVRTRIGNAEGKAPWWYIVNYGLYKASALHGRGGKAYPPKAVATRFVEKTELQLSTIFKQMLVTEKPDGKKVVDVSPVNTKDVGRDLGRALRGEIPLNDSFINEEYKTKVIERSKATGRFETAGYSEKYPKLAYSQRVKASNQYTDNE